MLTSGLFRSKWWMVAAALVALTTNSGVIQSFSLGVFIVPITKDLGITRGEFLSVPVYGSFFFLMITPFFGKALDRYGLRKVHMVMIVGYALGTMSLAFLRMPYYLMLLPFFFQHIFGAGQSPIAYTKAIAAWFDKDRGLALGIAIAGVGLGVAIIPPYDAWVIAHYGWRAGFIGMGAAILVLALIPVFLFEREPPIPPERARPKNDTSIPGYSWTEAVLKDWRFPAMTIVFFLAPITINGVVAQVVPMLTDRGVPLAVAVAALSASGIALTGGRIISGYCLDKIHGPYVAAFFFIASGIGIAMLAARIAPFIGTILCGAGIGAEVDIMAFLVSRYFGLRSFGAVYATMFAFFSIGVGMGPFFLGLSHDKYGSYVPMMMLDLVLIVVMCGLLLGLGPYRFAVRVHPVGRVADAAAE